MPSPGQMAGLCLLRYEHIKSVEGEKLFWVLHPEDGDSEILRNVAMYQPTRRNIQEYLTLYRYRGESLKSRFSLIYFKVGLLKT